MSYYPGILPPPPLPAAAAVLQGGLTRNLYSDLESSPNPGGGILRAWDLLGLSFGVIPGASSPSWRKPSWGGGIPGSVSEGESGLGQSSPSPSSWLRAQAGFVSFAYICIYASFTCAPWQGPQKVTCAGAPKGNQSGRLPAGASKPRNLGPWSITHPMPEPCICAAEARAKCLNLRMKHLASSLGSCGSQARNLRVTLASALFRYSHQAQRFAFEPPFSGSPSFPLPLPPTCWALPPHFTLDLFATAS